MTEMVRRRSFLDAVTFAFQGATALMFVFAPCVAHARAVADEIEEDRAVDVGNVSAEPVAPEQPSPMARALLITGSALAGGGLLAAATGFAAWGGIHAGNPGRGLSLVADEPAQAQRVVRLARGMEGLAWSGVALMVSGAVLATVGGVTLRRQPRASRRISAGVGGSMLWISGRF